MTPTLLHIQRITLKHKTYDANKLVKIFKYKSADNTVGLDITISRVKRTNFTKIFALIWTSVSAIELYLFHTHYNLYDTLGNKKLF